MRPNVQSITGQRISLRPVTLEDCTQAYVDWLNDPVVNRYLETRWVRQDMATVREYVRDMIGREDSLLMAIVENSTGRHIGNIKVGPIHAKHRYADVSYFIGNRQAWGKGYATEAIGLVSKFAFENLDVRRLQAGVYASNLASMRALIRAGFRIEGRLTEKFLVEPGEWEDHVMFGKLRLDNTREEEP